MPTQPLPQWIADAHPGMAVRRGAGETDAPPELQAQAAEIEAAQYLGRLHPAVSAAVGLVARGIPVAAVDDVGGVTAEPLATRAQVVAHWSSKPHRDDHCALRTGRHGHFALVAVSVDTWPAWAAWRDAQCSDDVETLNGGRLSTRPEPRDLGHCASLSWSLPPPSAVDLDRVMSAAETLTRAEWRGAERARRDRGGALLWGIGTDPAGRLPAFRARRLADGVTVLPDGTLLQWTAAPRADGATLAADGIPDHSIGTPCPGWLLDLFGARWVRA